MVTEISQRHGDTRTNYNLRLVHEGMQYEASFAEQNEIEAKNRFYREIKGINSDFYYSFEELDIQCKKIDTPFSFCKKMDEQETS